MNSLVDRIHIQTSLTKEVVESFRHLLQIWMNQTHIERAKQKEKQITGSKDHDVAMHNKLLHMVGFLY